MRETAIETHNRAKYSAEFCEQLTPIRLWETAKPASWFCLKSALMLRSAKMRVMKEDQDQVLLLGFLAKKAKELYRENLVFRQVSEWLRAGDNPLFDSLVEDARKSKSVEAAAVLFESVIDARMPSSLADDEENLARWIQEQGLDRGPMN